MAFVSWGYTKVGKTTLRVRSGLIKKTNIYLQKLRGFIAGRLEESKSPLKAWKNVAIPRPSVNEWWILRNTALFPGM